MLAVLRKELRQSVSNLLALPGLAIAGGWAVTTLAAGQHRGMEYSNILEGAFGGGVTITCALVGLGFGFKQMLPETRVGAWAFLRHRPASPAQLYMGKLLAALVYYVLVVGIPLAGVIAWASTPGSFPGIWLWRMALPSLNDFLCGTVYIVAGLFIASREARWFGSRLLPLGLAVLCSFMTWLPWWWAGLIAIAIAWVLLLPAGLGAFLGRGRESRHGRVQRTLTAVTLLPAMIALPLFVTAFLDGMLQPQRALYGWAWYQVTGSDVFKSTYEGSRQFYSRVVGDNGEVLRDAPPMERPGQGYAAATLVIRAPEELHLGIRQYRRSADLMMRMQTASARNYEQWYYVDRENYLFGYRTDFIAPATPLGFIGANGFVTERRQLEPFKSDWRLLRFSPLAIVEPQRVLLPDLDARTCPVLFVAPADERVFSASMMFRSPGADEENRGKPYWAVSTNKATYLLDDRYQQVLRQPHVEGPYAHLSAGLTLDHSKAAFLYANQWHGTGVKQLFLRLNAAGETLARIGLPPIPRSSGTQSNCSEALQSLAIPPGAAAADLLWNRKPQRHHAWVLVPLAVSLTLSGWALRRYRTGRGAAVVWLITTALLGWAGTLLMLAIRDWPPRVFCGRCGRRTIATGVACRHCGAAFTVPDPGEVGVFDAATPQVAAAGP